MIALWLPVALCTPTPAVEAPDAQGWHARSALQARSNRPGFGLLSHTGWRAPLTDSEHLLLRGTYVEAGLVTQLSPASFHPGVYLEVLPVTPLLLRLTAQQLRFFGNFGALSDFEGPDATWDTAELDARQKDGGRHGTGVLAEGFAQLRLKVGPVLALWEERLAYLTADVPPGAGWYEPITDLLVADEDGLHTSKVSALGVVHGGPNDAEFAAVGVHFERYRTLEAGVERQILGGLGLWRPGLWPESHLTFALLAGYLPVDAHRQGALYVGGMAQVYTGAAP